MAFAYQFSLFSLLGDNEWLPFRMSSLSSTCILCNGPNASFRCAQCKQVNYCSRECQRNGWKVHKKACRAWGELNNHVQALPLDEAQRHFQQAQETIEQLEKIVKKEKEPIDLVPCVKSISKNASPISVRDSPAQKPTLQEKAKKKPLLKPETLPQTQAVNFVKVTEKSICTVHPEWHCTTEELVHLDSYQITLRPRVISNMPDAIPDVQLEPVSNNNATLVRIGDLLSWRVSATVSDCRASLLPGDCLSIRLQCTPDAFMVPFYSNTNTTPKIEQLACKSCDSQLLLPETIIDRVVPLPSGYWDEITDYIQCYPGEAAVDFGTTIVPPLSAWEDAHVFVLNPRDIRDVAATTLPSVDPYGTTSVTEALSWQPEGRQVETLCCSYCCAALGVVTGQGYHLYKHRLELLQENEGVLSTSTAAAVPIFIANELKRYAESQAIFTFVVTKMASAASSGGGGHKKASPCLLLHVLSWDSSMMEVSGEKTPFNKKESGSSSVKKRVVKVIYEEAAQMPAFQRDETNGNTDADIASWTWGGLDLCCDPGDAPTTKAKSVVLTLEDNEWMELASSLHSGYYFPQQVVDATILVKLGKTRESDEQVGMAALDLS